jgi:hypothetical protein
MQKKFITLAWLQFLAFLLLSVVRDIGNYDQVIHSFLHICNVHVQLNGLFTRNTNFLQCDLICKYIEAFQFVSYDQNLCCLTNFSKVIFPVSSKIP